MAGLDMFLEVYGICLRKRLWVVRVENTEKDGLDYGALFNEGPWPKCRHP